MREVCQGIWASVSSAVRTTPVEVLVTVLAAIAVSLAIADIGFEGTEIASLLVTAGLVLLVSFISSAARALRVFDARTRWLLNLCFGGAAVAYGVFVFDPEVVTELWRSAFLVVGAVGLISLVPLAARAGNASASERFWRFNVQLGARVILAAFYSTVLFTGLALGLFAIEVLFDLRVERSFVAHLGVWVVGALGVTLALAGLRDASRIDREFSQEVKVLGAQLGTWLFLPLMLLYLAIMYVYLAQVATGTAAPSNVLSPLALGAGLLGYLGLFLLHPVRGIGGYRVLNRALDAFPTAFIPLVGLGIWAVFERAEQYGWTEFRYARVAALVCLGAFSVVGTYKWIRRREFSLTSGPSIVAAVALLSAVGPWSASNVSYHSQLSRLEEKIAAHQLVGDDGMLLDAATLRAGDGGEIYSEVKYLLDAHGDESLASFTTTDLSGMYTYEQLAALGLDGVSDSRRTRVLRVDHQQPVSVPAGQLYALHVYPDSVHRADDLTGALDGTRLVVEVDGRSLISDLASLVPADYQAHETVKSSELQAPLVDERGDVYGRAVLRHVSYEELDSGWVPKYAEGFVVVAY